MCSTVRLPSPSPRRPPHHPPCLAIVLGSGFPFSRNPETRAGRAGQTLRIFPVLSAGWGEAAEPGRSAATTDRPAEQSLNRPGPQKKREKFRIFFRISGRNGDSRTHSPRVLLAPPVGPGPMPATDAPPLTTSNRTANTGTASPGLRPDPYSARYAPSFSERSAAPAWERGRGRSGVRFFPAPWDAFAPSTVAREVAARSWSRTRPG